MRNLSSRFKKALRGEETGDVTLIALTINHESFTEPIRVVYNTEPIEIEGNTYLPYPFQITLPDDREDELPEVQLRIDNIDRLLTQSLREAQGVPEISMLVVSYYEEDGDPVINVEVPPMDFALKEVEYNALEITATLGYEPLLDEPYPAEKFTPRDFPGLFKI